LNCGLIVQKYLSLLSDQFKTVDLGNSCLITTPYLSIDNDYIEIIAFKTDDGSWKLSDDGYCLDFLFLNGLEIKTINRKNILESVSLIRGVTIENDEVFIKVEEDKLGEGFLNLIHAINSIVHIVYTGRAYNPIRFQDSVEEFLKESHITAIRNKKIAGATKDWVVDFEIEGNTPYLLQTLHSESKGWAENVANRTAIMWVELKRKEYNFKSISLIDDSENLGIFWSEQLKRMLEEYSDNVIYWTEKERILNIVEV
jgi:hypothetical protein